MPTPPDDHFESYLRQFRPLPPERMHFEKPSPTGRRGPTAAVWAAVAAVVLVALLTLYPRVRQPHRPDEVAQSDNTGYAANSQPLTIQSANTLLNHAPSFEAAVDTIAIPSHTSLPDGKQSALDVLSKDSKL